jgi:thiol-disulfide isomerase/thioredoxin
MQANPGSWVVQQDPPVGVRLSTGPIQSAPSSRLRVVIYYFHPTFRCTSCLLAESLAHQVVQEHWNDALDQGVLQWRLANIDLPENQSLTRLFAVDSSAVVAASVRDGKPVRWEKISQVWEQVQEPDTFRGRIHGQIMKLLSDE